MIISKSYKIFFSLLSLMFMLAFLNACDSGKPRNHPLYRKATLRFKEQKYDVAIELFEDFLLKQPKAYNVHLKLAKIYSQYGNDKVRELYHYRVYLDNTPGGQEHDAVEQLYKLEQFEFAKDIVLNNRNLLRTSNLSLPNKAEKSADQLHNEYIVRLKRTLKSFATQNNKSRAKIKQLEKKLKSAESKFKKNDSNYLTLQQESMSYKNRYLKMRDEYQQLKIQSTALSNKIASLEKFLDLIDKEAVAEVDKKKPNDDVTEDVEVTKDTKGAHHDDDTEEKSITDKNNIDKTKKIANKAFFHKVVAGDSLSKIAKEYYGNKRDAVRIMNANRLLLKNKNKLEVGMYLLIPKNKLYN